MRTRSLSTAIACLMAMSLFTAGQVQAQTPIHLVAGPNISNISSDDFPDSDSKVGFFVAVGTSLALGENVAVSPYVGYVMKGAEFDGEDASYDYIEIPVLFSTSFPMGETTRLGVFGGPQIGFFAAVGTSFTLSEKVSVSPYLAYVKKGVTFDGEDASYDYIEIPILLGTGFPVGETMTWNVFAGPQFGFQVNCDEDGFDCKEFSNHKGTEFGVVAGTGLEFPVSETGAFAVSIGADFGLTDLFDELDYKTRTYFLSLQYSTTLGGD